MKSRYSLETIKEMICLYEQGLSAQNIGSKFGASLQTVINLLRANNCEIRTNTRPQKYSRNSNYFEIIDSHIKAQILGFLYADGCILDRRRGMTLSIHISKKDIDYIWHIKQCIEYTGKIDMPIPNKSIRLQISDTKLCRDLTKLGCLPRKSLNLKFPDSNQVPIEFLNSFLLGYLEGDGCIYKRIRKNRISPVYKVSFCLTKEFGESLQSLLLEKFQIKSYLKIAHQYRNTNNSKNVYILHIERKQDMITFLSWMYKDTTFVMKRKYDKWTNLKKSSV